MKALKNDFRNTVKLNLKQQLEEHPGDIQECLKDCGVFVINKNVIFYQISKTFHGVEEDTGFEEFESYEMDEGALISYIFEETKKRRGAPSA